MLPMEKIFSLSEPDLSELLKKIKEECGSGKLPSDEISRLTSHLKSILSKLSTIQHGGGISPDLAAQVKKAIEIAQEDLRYWQDKMKDLATLQEQQKKQTEATAAEDRKANDEAIKRLVTELDTFFENIKKHDQEARLLANKQIEEFIKRSQEHEHTLLDEIEEINKQIGLEKAHVNELKQQVLANGLLAHIQKAHPSTDLPALQDKFDRYFDDPKARAGKKFNEFAEELGISKEEMDGYIHELNIEGTAKEIETSVEKIDTSGEQALQRNVGLVEVWVSNITAMEALEVSAPGATQTYLEAKSEVIAKCDPQAFTAYLEQRSKVVTTVVDEYKEVPKDLTNEVAQTKRKNLEERRDALSGDLKGLTHLARHKFGENNEKFTEMQRQVAALERMLYHELGLDVRRKDPGELLAEAAEKKDQPIGAAVPPPAVPPPPPPPPPPAKPGAPSKAEELKSLGEKIQLLNQELDKIDKDVDAAAKEPGKDNSAKIRSVNGSTRSKRKRTSLLSSKT